MQIKFGNVTKLFNNDIIKKVLAKEKEMGKV